jgi:hypothetical protein
MSEQPDIHAHLMSKYPQVPEWWYALIFLSMFIFGIISIDVWHTNFPVWAFVLALLIGTWSSSIMSIYRESSSNSAQLSCT